MEGFCRGHAWSIDCTHVELKSECGHVRYIDVLCLFLNTDAPGVEVESQAAEEINWQYLVLLHPVHPQSSLPSIV